MFCWIEKHELVKILGHRAEFVTLNSVSKTSFRTPITFFTTSLKSSEWTMLPDVPVIVTMNVPAGVRLDVRIVRVLGVFGRIGFGTRVAVVPRGKPERLSDTGEENSSIGTTETE